MPQEFLTPPERLRYQTVPASLLETDIRQHFHLTEADRVFLTSFRGAAYGASARSLMARRLLGPGSGFYSLFGKVAGHGSWQIAQAFPDTSQGAEPLPTSLPAVTVNLALTNVSTT